MPSSSVGGGTSSMNGNRNSVQSPATDQSSINGSTLGIINGPDGFAAVVEKRTASWWYLRKAYDG